MPEPTEAVATQTIKIIGGPRDGEMYTYEYVGTPLFWVEIEEDYGVNYLYRMCSDGKFRLEKHADEFDRQVKREKRKKRGEQ